MTTVLESPRPVQKLKSPSRLTHKSSCHGFKPKLEPLEGRVLPSVATPDVDLSTRASSGTINDAIFTQYTPQPTGTGYIHSFLRVQSPGNATTEQGYNTDARPLQFDELKTANFTRSIRLSEVAEVSISGVPYRAFMLDINQSSKSPLLSLDKLQIFVSASGNLTGYNTTAGKLAGLSPVYDLDANADHWVELNARLSSGSGSGDMVVYVPSSSFSGAGDNPYVYLFCRFGDNLGANGGFEEWSTAKGPGITSPPPATGPASLSGYVYADMDWSGERSSSDYALAGLTVTLSGTDVNGRAVNLTTTTDANGFYSFTGLVAGTYTVRHQTPALYYFDGASNVGTVGGSYDGFVNTDGSIGQITLKAGENGVNYNFGDILIPGS